MWIVSDIRRKTDVQWFKENYGSLVKTIRLVADEETRIERGFQFKNGVDDAISECGLDDFNEWDVIIDNGKDRKSLDSQLNSVMLLIDYL